MRSVRTTVFALVLTIITGCTETEEPQGQQPSEATPGTTGQATPGATGQTMPGVGQMVPGTGQARGGMGRTTPGTGMMGGAGMMGGMMGAGVMDGGTMQMMGQGIGIMATGGPGPHMMLQLREALELSDDQIRRLEEIRDRYAGAHPQMSSAMMEAQSRAGEAVQRDDPDLEAYERALREVTDAMVQMHVQLARAGVEARQVLTNQQREQLQEIGMGVMRGMTMPGGAMMGPGPR